MVSGTMGSCSRHNLVSWILLRRYAGVQELHNKKIHTKQGKNSSSPFFMQSQKSGFPHTITWHELSFLFFPGQNEQAAKGPQPIQQPERLRQRQASRAYAEAPQESSLSTRVPGKVATKGSISNMWSHKACSDYFRKRSHQLYVLKQPPQEAGCGHRAAPVIVLFPAFFRRRLSDCLARAKLHVQQKHPVPPLPGGREPHIKIPVLGDHRFGSSSGL